LHDVRGTSHRFCILLSLHSATRRVGDRLLVCLQFSCGVLNLQQFLDVRLHPGEGGVAVDHVLHGCILQLAAVYEDLLAVLIISLDQLLAVLSYVAPLHLRGHVIQGRPAGAVVDLALAVGGHVLVSVHHGLTVGD